jgi:hypothetical protein
MQREEILSLIQKHLSPALAAYHASGKDVNATLWLMVCNEEGVVITGPIKFSRRVFIEEMGYSETQVDGLQKLMDQEGTVVSIKHEIAGQPSRVFQSRVFFK